MAEKKNTFQLKIIAPDRLFFEGEADMLEFTTTEGDMGIYAGHMSSAVILVPCRINIHADGKVRSLMASGGFIAASQAAHSGTMPCPSYPPYVEHDGQVLAV